MCCKISLYLSIYLSILFFTGRFSRFRYKRFINIWLQSMASRGERHNSSKSIQTILCWSHPNMRCILWCLRSQFISAGWDPKNLTSCLNDRRPNSILQRSNTQLHLSAVKIQLTSFQNTQILRTISGHDVIHTPAPISCLGVYYDKWWLSYLLRAKNMTITICHLEVDVIVISFARERQTAPNNSKPYQTEW